MLKFRRLAGITLLIAMPAIGWGQQPPAESESPYGEVIGLPASTIRSPRPAAKTWVRQLPDVIVPYSQADQKVGYSETLFGRIGAWLTGGSCGTSTPAGDESINKCRPSVFSICSLRPSCKTCETSPDSPACAPAWSWPSFCLPMPWHPRTRGQIKPPCTSTYCVQQGGSTIKRACDNSYRRGPLPQPVCDGPIEHFNKIPQREGGQ